MRLTAFDDMDNYNKNMKVALKCLSVILQSNHEVNKEKVYKPLVQIFKAHYRSDLIHRRIKPALDALKEDIESSSLPANGKEDFLNILEENLCNTLDKIDAIFRFKLLLRDADFKNYLERFRFQLSKFSSSKDNSLKIQQKVILRNMTDLKLHLMKLCSDLHYNLSMNFDFSFSFEKGKQWMRIPNIFNLSNEIITRVRSSTKMKYLQQQKEIECNTNDLIESDIIPSKKRESATIKKTVNIEVGDMDLETINFPVPEEDSKGNGDSEASSPITSSNKEQEVEEKLTEEDPTRFRIKSFELTKKFMKGRQCGRENTPIRGRERKERKQKLAKINVHLPKSGEIKKAWDDDSQLSPVGTSIDQVESFPNLKEIKQDKMKTQLKQFQKKVKVVRVQSSRRDGKSSKRKIPRRVRMSKKRTRRKNMPPLPFTKAKTTPELKPPPIVNNEKEFSVKIASIWKKYLLKKALQKWKSSITISKEPKEESKTSENYITRGSHNENISEFANDPSSSMLQNKTTYTTTSQATPNLSQNKEETKNPPSSTTLQNPASSSTGVNPSLTIKHENSKSVPNSEMIGKDPQDLTSKRKQFDHSFSRSKPTQLPGFRDPAKSHKRRKTKEAFKKYKEINLMLEKIQREADQLSKQYREKGKRLGHQKTKTSQQ